MVKENVDNQENKFIILKNNKKIIILTVLFANLVADMQNDTLQLEYKSDILEDNILSISDTLLARLLKDNTTTPENAGDDFSKWNNIIWATEDYASKGEGFGFSDQITKEKITGENGMVIRPRALKSKDEQTARAKNMAEIFTPAWVCNAQINLCDNTWFGRENVFNTENYDTYSWTTNHNKIEFPEDKTWQDYLYDRRLEITCGEAPYIVSRYDAVTGDIYPVENHQIINIAGLDKMLKNVYSLPTSSIAYEFTIKVYKLLGMPTKNVISDFVCFDLINKNKNVYIEKLKNMKLTTIIGNPPYQVMDGGAQASASPIYHEFIRLAKIVSPKEITMIMPARWYTGGKGLDEFRDEMLNDKHIKELHDCLNPETIFPNTNVRGGICYFDWNVHFNNTKKGVRVVTHRRDRITSDIKRSLKIDGTEIFVRSGEAISILNKIFVKQKTESFEKYVSTLRPFGLRGYFAKDENCKNTKDGMTNPVGIYVKGQKLYYVEKELIPIHSDWVDLWKVFASRANNIGTELNDDNFNAFIGRPNTICTESFMVLTVGMTLNETSAQNIVTYFKTKFARALHSLAKTSQDATSKTYRFVPLQDFSPSSDIDWSKSIKDIDIQLYKKYELSNEEIDYIESVIKPMETDNA